MADFSVVSVALCCLCCDYVCHGDRGLWCMLVSAWFGRLTCSMMEILLVKNMFAVIVVVTIIVIVVVNAC